MEESILTSIKKLLGQTKEYTAFDTDIIMHINTVFMTLNQLGVGTEEVFNIEDDLSVWKDFLGDDEKKFSGVKTYIYQRVKLIFDPPSNSAHIQALERSINEFEWRCRYQAESK